MRSVTFNLVSESGPISIDIGLESKIMVVSAQSGQSTRGTMLLMIVTDCSLCKYSDVTILNPISLSFGRLYSYQF